MTWPLSFISENDFHRHVEATIKHYGNKLEPYDLKKFNKNLVDPIKLIFDKSVYRFSWEEIVKNEVFRQRDKSNNNDIGYFHQRMFQYIANCEVPLTGWDIVFSKEDGIFIGNDTVSRVFVEMKNKHNTMNSASGAKTYIRMQSQLLADDSCACLLVEVIAKKSQDITWEVTVDGEKKRHRLIRRVSLDKFYELVTGEKEAFYKICMILPEVINSVISQAALHIIPQDFVMEELRKDSYSKDNSIAMALYMLGFESYEGFKKGE